MKILFIFRQGFESDYLLNKLKNINYNYKVVIERGSTARSAKLKRTFLKKNVFQKIISAIDLLVLAILMKFYELYFKYSIKEKYLKNITPDLLVEDVNEKKCIQFTKNYKADVIFIFGTAIIRSEFLQSVSSTIFNIHTGILPKYRNVHSDFWAYIKGDINNIGVSIIYLDKGIDSGDIALIRKIKVRKVDSFFNIKIKIIKKVPFLVKEVIEKHVSNKIKRVKQNHQKSKFYATPGLKEVLRLVLVSISKL